MSQTPTENSHKIVILGLDGATFDLIYPWAKAGYLPYLAHLMENGYHAPLRSTLQPVTSAAWSSFMTGVNQGKHGLYDFIRRQEGRYSIEVTTGNHIKFPTIFDMVSAAGKQVISINMPYTYPARKVNGIMISGPFAPALNQDAVYPPEILQDVRSRIPDYFIFPSFDPRHVDPLADYLGKLLLEIEQRELLSIDYMTSHDWDLFSVVFMATDEVQHAYWHLMERQHPKYGDAIFRVYQRVDRAIGKILSTLDDIPEEKTIFVVSDHGGGRLKWVLNLNRWLEEQGFLSFQHGGKGILSQTKSFVLKSLSTAYKYSVPPPIREKIRREMGNRRFDFLKSTLETELLAAPIDWKHTQVYALGAGGNLFVNLKGREPNGIISEGAEYNAICDAVIKHLHTLKDPDTQSPIIKRVYRKEEIYTGECLPKAPDLIIEWVDYTVWGRGRYDSHAPLFEKQNQLDFSNVPLTGTHRPHGILIAFGDAIAARQHQARLPESFSVMDIAPTILGLLNIPFPQATDGQPLISILRPEIRANFQQLAVNPDKENPVAFSYAKEDEQKIVERLRSLGYM